MISKANRLRDVKEYYFSKKLREVGQLIESGKPIISLGIGSPDLNPPKNVLDVQQIFWLSFPLSSSLVVFVVVVLVLIAMVVYPPVGN